MTLTILKILGLQCNAFSKNDHHISSPTCSSRTFLLLSIRKWSLGTSLVVQWLRIYLPMQGSQVWSLLGELRSHMLWGNSSPPATAREATCCNEDPAQSERKKKKMRRNGVCFPSTWAWVGLFLFWPVECDWNNTILRLDQKKKIRHLSDSLLSLSLSLSFP